MKRCLLVPVLAALVAASVGGCRVETFTAPTGDLTLFATFDDVQDLTAGHDVQSSNVTIGSVQGIALDDYRARVEMSIVDGREIPEGTRAVVRHTSVLGEAFVDLVLPDGFDPATASYLADGDEIVDTDTQDGIEQLAAEAAGIIDALAGADVAELLETGSIALTGRGEKLNRLVDDAASVADTLAAQDDDISTVIDELGRIGAAVAPRTDEVVTMLDELAVVTEETAAGRDRIVEAVEALVGLAAITTDAVLEPHAERLLTLLDEASPILGELAARSDVLEGLITDLLRFTDRFPTAVHNGQVLLHTWAFVEPEALTSQLYGLPPLDVLQELLEGGG